MTAAAEILGSEVWDALEAERDRLKTAWWSARIGRAMVRLTLDRTRDALSEAIVEEQELLRAAEAERDQLQATLARVRELAVMGGQDPILVRQWIIAEVTQYPPPAGPAPGQPADTIGQPT